MNTTCAKNIIIDGVKPGEVIVNSVFAHIQTLLTSIGALIYVQIVNTFSFQFILGAVLGLYVTIYGIMVVLNLASHSLGEITSRLMRIAIVYGLLSYGVSSYIWFDRLFVTPFLGGMNELITYFSWAAGVATPAIPPPLTLLPPMSSVLTTFLNAVVAPSLSPTAVSALYIPMNIIFSPFYIIAIIGLIFLKGNGPIIALLMVWAFIEFTMLVLNALVTYVRSILGLTFMFGIAPLFIIFALFQRTRTLFEGWLNVVIGFAISPVMLFAYLSFYCLLLTAVLQNMFVGFDFCLGKLFTISGSTVDVVWWRPAILSSGKWTIYGGDYDLPPPLNIVSILFFLFLSHLGKNFSYLMGDLAASVTDGISGTITPAMSAGRIFNSGVLGGRGTGKSGLAGAFGAGAKQGAKNSAMTGAPDATDLVTKR
jgi:type IV secretion system protein VirB6